jgi:hypothetical protein
MFWVKKLITQAMKNGNLNFQTFGAGAQGGGFSYSSTSAGGFPGEQSPFEQFETRESSLNEQIDGDVIEAEYTEKK